MRQDSQERRVESRPDGGPHQAALLIDFDNVTMGIRSNLGQELRNLLNSHVIRGKVAVQRAYADWRRYPQYIVPLSESSIDLIFAPAYGSSKKNATDIRLAIDALELVFIRPEIRTFILMSGDSDFSSLVLKLKEYGKYVIGVGIQESSSDLLVQNCDEYYSYSALSGLSKAGDQPLERHDPWELAAKAVRKMVGRGDTMRSDRLKQVMLEIDPSFNEKEQGYNKFNRFVVDAASRGLLSIQKMDNGQYGVAPSDETVSAAKGEVRERQKEPRRAPAARRRKEPAGGQSEERPPPSGEGRTRRARPKLTMKAALELLDQVLSALLEGKDGTVRDSDVKRRMLELDPRFDEGELGYSKFCKFLQAAHEEGAVELTRGPNGNFEVGLRRSKKRRGRQPRESAQAGSSTAEKTMNKIARFLFGAKEKEAEGGAPVPSAPEPSAPSPEAEREPRGKPREREQDRTREEEARADRARREARGRDRHPRAEGAARGERERRGERHRGPQTGESRPREERPRDREPRRERQARAQRERGERGAPPVREEPAPVETPVEGGPEYGERTTPTSTAAAAASRPETNAEAVSREAHAVTPAPLPGAPRGTIRGRWGTRGRYRPSQARPPIFDGQKTAEPGAPSERAAKSEPPEDKPVQGPAPAAEGPLGPEAQALVAHLSRYAGVGQRTAEVLVRAFGTDLLRVLDEEPQRVRDVLPDHRAERVLEARREEREAAAP
ncbi:MAG: NYN domain-containing protein [Gemmatimonadota bacterium]|nr:MAG: NYN domain-containing protein [Gemmatimonadota bacterium]